MFSGEVVHRDSLGNEQPIEPGAVNWMVAGSGITHSERFERARAQGDLLHGIQSWVALPREYEECPPQFAHHAGADLPVLAAQGASARLIAGEAFGLTARVAVHSPLFYVHWELQAGAAVQLPAGYPERALYIAAGTVEAEGRSWHAGQLLIFAPQEAAVVKAAQPAILMGLGGEPLGRRFIEWNFVSSSQERIEQAKADWRAGRMKLPDLDNREFIPLP
ncbi:MAG TPA: pirin-like C-terminal cupin domain-containing protein [Steroidobacteraceae bacterium]|nr:pirin-like C-terminal cupin domain-containing protein [Steroidobacteraceae bacterium]